jgi:hypothetical protein
MLKIGCWPASSPERTTASRNALSWDSTELQPEPQRRPPRSILLSLASIASLSSASASGFLGRLQQSKTLEVVVTILSFGTNKLVARGAAWLKRNGLVKYVLPVMLANEGFGAYRVYIAGGSIGWW